MIRDIKRVTASGSLFIAVLFASGCSLINPPVTEPDPATVVAIVRVEPDRPWMDTGLTVRKGDQLFFTATGEIHWAARGTASGPDGINGLVGWRVGPGGLVGRVGDRGKPFAIGDRTTPFPDQHARPPHRRHPPPPVKVPRDGKLFLGFRDFTSGDNQGSFEVTIRPKKR